MSTPQSTTSGDASKNNSLEQITFRFCSECSNMLYPKEDEDSHKLMFTCRTCQYTEEATSSCVFRHVLNSAAGETAGVTQDVGSDPTVCGPVSSRPSDLPVAAPAADSTMALCLRCGITLLHCSRCKDPASVEEYNNCVLQNSDFAVDRCVHHVQLANFWEAMDDEARDSLVDSFSTCSGLVIPRWPEESISHYLPIDIELDPEADPPEALGMEPSFYDVFSTPN